MSLEDMHKTHENLSMKGVWVQRGMLVGKWARQRTHILVLVGMLLLIGAVFLTPILSGVRATSNEQFTAAGDWSTYGYDNARDNFNAAETIITPATAPQFKQKWVHAGNNGISDQIAAVNGVAYWGSWDTASWRSSSEAATPISMLLTRVMAASCGTGRWDPHPAPSSGTPRPTSMARSTSGPLPSGIVHWCSPSSSSWTRALERSSIPSVSSHLAVSAEDCGARPPSMRARTRSSSLPAILAPVAVRSPMASPWSN